MVRAPCCDDNMGLKKGPWTPEEDRILVSYIQNHGHGNWRSLPLLSGLSRCGKSCRLRWINYLRPDIKRGNFTKEEEETIFQLHEMLGNRWSTIAAKLPGRTDNEIKNVWHTHLKKRLRLKKVQSSIDELKPEPKTEPKPSISPALITAPRPSLSETSTMTEASVVVGEVNNIENAIEPVIDESFWSDPPLSVDLAGWLSGSNDITVDAVDGLSMDSCNGELVTWDPSYMQVLDEGMEMDFWCNLFAEDDRGGHELPEF